MKLRNKLILTLLLLIGFIVINSPKVFAQFDEMSNCPYYDTFISQISSYPQYNDTCNYACIQNTSNNSTYYVVSNLPQYPYFAIAHYYYDRSDGTMRNQPNIVNVKYNENNTLTVNQNKFLVVTIDENAIVSTSTKKSVSLPSAYSNYSILYSKADFYYSKITQNIMLPSTLSNPEKIVLDTPPEPENKFQEMFELYLTDKDDNNKQHRFNIGTYSSSEYYSELYNYFGRPYVIYLSDYERILTYDSEENKNFQYGSYLLSGYVDFLLTDNSYFYFSEYYNKILSDSGNIFFNKDEKDYKKRFYFRLTYSEDSNDPNAEIWDDNGILQSISDKYSDPFYEVDYSHFIGGSHTIYYAKEKNGKKKGMSNRIYYRGFYNFKLNAGGPTRNMNDLNNLTMQYFFSFSGGNTQILYLHHPDYNYNEQIKNVYDNKKRIYDKYVFSSDANSNDWHIEGEHESTSTYTETELTDQSTDEDFKDHTGEIRDPSRGNIQNKDDEKTEDTSNWGILDFLRGIYNAITGGDDSSGTTNAINNSVDTVTNKFAFKDNIVNNANEIKDYIVNTQATHKYYLNINHKYLSGSVCIIDLSWYEPYKPTVDAFICAFAYLAFIWRIFCVIPSLVNGSSASSYIQDISAYTHTGFGRSSNIHKGGF